MDVDEDEAFLYGGGEESTAARAFGSSAVPLPLRNDQLISRSYRSCCWRDCLGCWVSSF